jgi:uncharacterized lipoprotein YbaY
MSVLRDISAYSTGAARLCLLFLWASVAAGCGGGQGDNVQTRLSGDVTSADKVPLPAGSTLEIRLEDSSGPPGAEPLARATVDPTGRQWPIPFSLSFPRSALQEKHRYVLRAAVRSSSGDVVFTTPQDQPPLENPNTTGRIELSLLRASAAR